MNENKESESYIVFEVAGAVYGVNSRLVQQLEMVGNITHVPNTSQYVEGVMFSRGQVIPVINLRLRFGLERKEFDVRTRVIVVRNQERVAGIIVDSAKEYIRIPAESVQPAPEFMSGQERSFLDGIARLGDRVILIFNVPELMKTEEQKITTN